MANVMKASVAAAAGAFSILSSRFRTDPLCIMTMRMFILAAALFGLAWPLSAHDGEHGFTVRPGASAWIENRLQLAPVIENGGGLIFTLRGISAPGTSKVRLLRVRRILGTEQVQNLNFLRIDAGETITLGPPDFRLELEGVDRSLRDIQLLFNFGPDGALMLRHPLPGR